MAGGTGIAPLRSMICHAFNTPVSADGCIFSTARARPADFAYLPSCGGMRSEGPAGSRAERDARGVRRDGEASEGRITPEQLARLVEDPATLCFVCGPAAMVDEVPRMLMQMGIERKRIRIEEW